MSGLVVSGSRLKTIVKQDSYQRAVQIGSLHLDDGNVNEPVTSVARSAQNGSRMKKQPSYLKAVGELSPEADNSMAVNITCTPHAKLDTQLKN